jgi:hypothetical protein
MLHTGGTLLEMRKDALQRLPTRLVPNMGDKCFHIVRKFDRLGFLFCYAGDTMSYTWDWFWAYTTEPYPGPVLGL